VTVTVDRLIEICLALMTIFIGYTSFMMATRTTRIERNAAVRAVDAGAFDRAKVIYEGALDTLRAELEACRVELASAHGELVACRAELAAAHRDMMGARHEIAGLRTEITTLKYEIATMRKRRD
jgi:chromosome segregation ATPase